TIHGGRDHALRQTVIALAGGEDLGEHESPGEATLQVLRGHVRLHTVDRQVWVGHSGDYVIIPPVRHDLSALEDAVVVLSTSMPRPQGDWHRTPFGPLGVTTPGCRGRPALPRWRARVRQEVSAHDRTASPSAARP